MNYRSRYITALGQLQSLPGASSSLPLFVLQRWSSYTFPYYTLYTHTHTHTSLATDKAQPHCFVLN